MTKQRDAIGTKRRWSILERHNFTCMFCSARPGNDRLHVDHLLPHSLGGSDHDNNLVSACDRCNTGKSVRVAVPSSMLDGFIGADGMKTWKRWGEWHLMFDPAVMVLTFKPNGRDYWIPHNRFHEPDWERHLRTKPWLQDAADLEQWDEIRRRVLPKRERAALTLPEMTEQLRLLAPYGGQRPNGGEPWRQFCDAIDFARTLARKDAR